MTTATFTGTYTQNNGEDYAAGTVAITPYGGATVTATLDAVGHYSVVVTLVLTAVGGVWLTDAGEIVTSGPVSGFQIIPPGGTVTKGKCRIVESITGKAAVTTVRDVPDGATVDTGRDVGTVLGGSDSIPPGTYVPMALARPNNFTVFLGDSITLGSDDNAIQNRGASWPNIAAIVSGQRIQYVRNAGIAGNTAAQMLARFDTDVTPYAPRTVTLAAGTNDTGVTLLPAWQTTIVALVAKVRAISAVPVLCTIPPTDSTTPTNRKQQVSEFNAWLRRYASEQGIALIDFYSLLVDPATGNYKSAYLNDGTHPNAAGYVAMGNLASTALANLLPPAAVQLCADDADENSALFKGCFGGYSGTTVPTGWVDAAGIPSGSVLSYVTDSAVPGQMLRLTHTATAAVRQLAYTSYFGTTTLNNTAAAGATSIVLANRADYAGVLFMGSGATFEIVKILSSVGGGPQTETLVRPLRFAHTAGETVIANGIPGDTVVFSGVLTSDGGIPVSITTACAGAAYSPSPVNLLTAAITRGVFHQRIVIPTGTTPTIIFRLQAGAGTGVVSFGQVGVYNATRLEAGA